MEKRYYHIMQKDYDDAEQNGVSPELLEARVWYRDWDIDRAVTTPRKARRCFKKTWDKWEPIAIKNDVDRAIFTNRVRSLGWSEDDAARVGRGKSRRASFWTDEEKAIAKRLGIDGNSMGLPRIRMKNLGWSRERAVNTPKITEEQRVINVAKGTRKYHEERGTNREFNQFV